MQVQSDEGREVQPQPCTCVSCVLCVCVCVVAPHLASLPLFNPKSSTLAFPHCIVLETLRAPSSLTASLALKQDAPNPRLEHDISYLDEIQVFHECRASLFFPILCPRLVNITPRLVNVSPRLVNVSSL